MNLLKFICMFSPEYVYPNHQRFARKISKISEIGPYAYELMRARARVSLLCRGGCVFRSTSGNLGILPIECP